MVAGSILISVLSFTSLKIEIRSFVDLLQGLKLKCHAAGEMQGSSSNCLQLEIFKNVLLVEIKIFKNLGVLNVGLL